MALNTGDTLLNGQYHILQLLGRGGFGFVYHAEDTHLREQVAIKELIPALVGDEAMLRRFLAEARATMRLTHRHIVRTYHVFPETGNDYIVMEYMAGGSLEDRLRPGGCLPVEEVVRMAVQVCEGLSCAHEAQVVHCDLKPANILFDAAGRAKIADFGIAHVSGEMLTRSWMTPAGFVAGTLPYMSPEQTDGVRDEPRIDLYALGAVLYRALTGHTYLAFDTQETPRAQALNVGRIYDELPLPPSRHNPAIPGWLDGVVLKALAKRPAERWASAEAMRGALMQGQSGSTPLEGPPPPPTRAIADREARAAAYPPARPPAAPERSQAKPAQVVAAPAGRPAGATDREPRAFTYPPARSISPEREAPAGTAPMSSPAAADQQPRAYAYQPKAPVTVNGARGWTRPEWFGPAAIAVVVLAAILIIGSSVFEGRGTATATPPPPTAAPQVVSTQAAAALTDTPNPGEPAGGSPQTRSKDGMVMVYVPAGEFLMGTSEEQMLAVLASCSDCTRENFVDEQPQHTVRLDGFWIDKTEVSNAQYRRCVETGFCRPPGGYESRSRSSYYSDSRYDNYPVIFVNWNQAQAYCDWAGGRLPTEAEWEKAARGPNGQVYPWGNEPANCDRANYWGKDGGCVGDTVAVDSYATTGLSPYLALNMVGNVSEWVADWYAADYYAHSRRENPTGPETGERRVVRGGNLVTGGVDNRAAYRNYAQAPAYQVYYIGFRCAWDSPGE